MKKHILIGLAALLPAVVAGGPSAAFELKPSRLEALAARHDLCDEVCIALADGKLSDWERTEILIDAKRILYPREFTGFKRALDRVAPPPKKIVPKTVAENGRYWKRSSRNHVGLQWAFAWVSWPKKKPAAEHSVAGRPRQAERGKVASESRRRRKPPAKTSPPSAERPASGPVIPAGAILPDRMASRVVPR